MSTVVPQSYESVALDDIKPHPDNPRRGDVDAITSSIEHNGFFGALLVQRSTGYIIAGNHRYYAAREAGIDKLPALFADVDDMRAKRILLVDNKSADLATWDDEALTALLSELSGDDDGLAGSLFSEAELADLLALSDDESEHVAADSGPFDADTVIEAAFAHYREHGFPWPSMPLHQRWQHVNRLASTETDALRSSTVAYHVADTYHPQRFMTPIAGKVTPVEAFNNDEKLSHALRLCIEDGKVINDATLLSTLAYVRGAQCAAQFRPAFALWYLRRFCPDDGVWLDTSAGWGGRLVAFAASHAARYIAIDPSTSAHDGNSALARDLGVSERVQMLKLPAEDVAVADVGGEASCDFAFTSPPYFSKERYSDEASQSYMRYPSGELWRDGFLLPTLTLQHAALKHGAHAVINIADVRVENDELPLVEWTIDCAKRVGFAHVATEEFPMPRTPGRGERPERSEPCVVLRKIELSERDDS